MSISLVCYIVAAVFFFLAATAPKTYHIPLGLFFFVLGHVLAGVAFRAV